MRSVLKKEVIGSGLTLPPLPLVLQSLTRVKTNLPPMTNGTHKQRTSIHGRLNEETPPLAVEEDKEGTNWKITPPHYESLSIKKLVDMVKSKPDSKKGDK